MNPLRKSHNRFLWMMRRECKAVMCHAHKHKSAVNPVFRSIQRYINESNIGLVLLRMIAYINVSINKRFKTLFVFSRLKCAGIVNIERQSSKVEVTSTLATHFLNRKIMHEAHVIQ